MKQLLTIKGMIVAGVIAMIVAGSVAYAAHLVFSVNLTGSVQVSISSTEPIELFAEDGVTHINDGKVIDFGAAEVDFFGRGPVPVRGPFFVKNVSNGPVRVEVTGDPEGDILPLFGPTPADLKPAPDNAFILPGPGEGDTVEGYLGLRLLAPSAGNKQTTITFSATEIVAPPAEPARIAFSSSRDGNFEVYVMDVDGSNQTRLTDDAAFAGGGDWSPDGAEIAFFSDRDGGEFFDIFVMDADGSNQANLTISSSDDVWPQGPPTGAKSPSTRIERAPGIYT